MTALVLAYGAGLLATVNPCGFIMLPTFVSYYLGDVDRERGASATARIGRGVATGGALTAGFAAVFVVAGAGLALGFRLLARVVPWLAVGIGGLLIIIGAGVVLGRRVGLTIGSPRQRTGRRGYGAIAVFGAAYAVASLSCTVAVFLALLAQASSTSNLPGLVGVLALYVAGSATVLVSVSLSASLARGAIARWLRHVLPLVTRVSGALLMVSGAYLMAYWVPQLTNPGTVAPAWVTAVPQSVSADLSRLMAEHQPVIAIAGSCLAAVAIVVGIQARRHEAEDPRSPARATSPMAPKEGP